MSFRKPAVKRALALATLVALTAPAWLASFGRDVDAAPLLQEDGHGLAQA